MRRITGELPTLLTFRQAARELSYSLTKVKAMVKAGLIQTVKPDPDGHPRIPKTEVTRLASVAGDKPSRKRDGSRQTVRERRHTRSVGADAKTEAEQLRAKVRAKRKKPRG